jgi:hypothetical protein
MKLIARILAILAAALVVVGVTFAISQTSFAQSTLPAMPDRAAQASSTATQVSATPPQRGPGGEHGGQGMSLFGAIDLLQNVVVVGAIVAMVALAKRLWARIAGGSEKSKGKRASRSPSAT